MTQECGNCFFWRWQECRKKTPIHTDEEFGIWPKTESDDWCGEWRPVRD